MTFKIKPVVDKESFWRQILKRKIQIYHSAKIKKVWNSSSFNVALSFQNHNKYFYLIQKTYMPKKVQKIDPDFELASESQSSQNIRYRYISYETRISLIKLVFQEKMKILSAASKLDLKISTAKHILKSFRENGKIHRKKQEKNMIFQEDLLENKELREKIIKTGKERLQKKAERLEKKERKMNYDEVIQQNIPNTVANQVPNIQDCQKSTEREPQYFQIFYDMNFNHQYLIVDPSIQNRSMMTTPDFFLVQPYLL